MATAAMLGSVAVVPVAEAVSVNPDGMGQVLVFPYYNTNNNFQTSFNVRNTKDEYKAVKVRLRESKNSNDVLDFNVYMSPFDVFTFTVVPNGVGNPILQTVDKTCTFPAIPAAGQPLKGTVYKATTVEDAREGYVEIIEMGVIADIDLLNDAAVVLDGESVLSGLLHDATGTPKDCSVITQALSDGIWSRGGALATDAPTSHGDATPDGFTTPGGGLAGTSILIDTANGAAFVADPVALVDYAANALVGSTNTTGAQYYLPNDGAFFLFPSLASGNVQQSNVVSNDMKNIITEDWGLVVADFGPSDPNAELVNDAAGPSSGINPFPVSHALAATSVSNEYFIDPTFNGATDWVITYPMKKHGIFNGGIYVADSAGDGSNVPGFIVDTGHDDVLYSSGTFFDREEQIPSTPDTSDFSPVVVAATGDLQLEREVNILTFASEGNDTNPVLGSTNNDTFTLDAGFVSGWATLSLKTPADYDLDQTDGRWDLWTGAAAATATGVTGVPTMGFAAIRGNIGDATKNVGETLPHTFSRDR